MFMSVFLRVMCVYVGGYLKNPKKASGHLELEI